MAVCNFSPFKKNNLANLTVATVTMFISIAVLTACTPANHDKADTKSDVKTAVNTDSTNGNPTTDTPIIYASTNVWGAVAQAVGGDNVKVIVGVNEPTQDPHDYQATAQDKLNISKAKLVLVNGGGYDDWAVSLAEAVKPQPVLINAVKVSGFSVPSPTTHEAHDQGQNEKQGQANQDLHHSADFNEHVFYSLDTASKVAQAVANQLSQADPNHQTQYTQNLQDFNQQISELKTQAKATPTGKTVFFTEPVAGYLLADMGIKNITPNEFIEQAETDTGVSAKVLQDSKTLLANKQASVLVLNAQTEDATSKILVTDANTAHIPVVNLYETLPAPLSTEVKGNEYIDFIKKAISDLQQALK